MNKRTIAELPSEGHRKNSCANGRIDQSQLSSIRSALSDASCKFNLLHLRALQRVGRLGTVSSAARSLFRAQSAVTRSIQELETYVATPLFERGRTGMEPTAAGRCVLARVEIAFSELEVFGLWLHQGRSSQGRDIPPGFLPPSLINTRRLRTFIVVALSRHLPTAAKHLGVTQPAISISIKALEAGIGHQLFQRGSRTLALTTTGEKLLVHARRALSELRHIDADLKALEGTIGGVVTIGNLPFGRTIILPEVIARLSKLYPALRFVTLESPFELLAVDLRAGDVDFIFGALRHVTGDDDMVNETLIEEKITIACRKGHPLAKCRNVRLADLVNERWILPSHRVPSRALLDNLFVNAGLAPPTECVQSGDMEMVHELLLRTNMIAAWSQSRIFYGCVSERLVAIDISLSGTERHIGITRRTTIKPSPGTVATIEMIRAVVAELSNAKSLLTL